MSVRVSSLGSGCLRPACLAVALWLAAAGTAAAQDPAKEFWPEIDAWWRLVFRWEGKNALDVRLMDYHKQQVGP